MSTNISGQLHRVPTPNRATQSHTPIYSSDSLTHHAGTSSTLSGISDSYADRITLGITSMQPSGIKDLMQQVSERVRCII